MGCFLRLVWVLFVAFTTLHLLANYRAVRVVTMETLNQARLHLVMMSYLSKSEVPLVNAINLREPILTRRFLYVSVVLITLTLTHARTHHTHTHTHTHQPQGGVCTMHWEYLSVTSSRGNG